MFLKQLIIKGLYSCLSLLDKLNRSNDKIVKEFDVDGVQILTPEGWSNLSHIQMTRPFEQYTIKTFAGKTITCADDHILYSGDIECYARDLYEGQLIDTVDGVDVISSIGIDYHRVSMGDVTMDNNSHTLYTNGLKSHNTITSSLFMLHYICFNVDKAALVIANKFKTAKEVLKKAKDIYMELPFFLKPGIQKWNEAEIAMDNGCLINAETTTVNSGIGFTYHCVLCDEFAHLPTSIAEEFYSNLFPVITAANARFMITSTQNGRNLFYRLYTGAVQGDNDYAPFSVTWADVPNWNPDKEQWEQRDERWHKRMVANLGSEEAFNKQYGINFDLGANTLISQKTINSVEIKKFVQKDLPGIVGFDSWWWHPDYEPTEQLRKDFLVMTVDIGEQVGQDPTVFSIYRMVNPGTNDLELIGYYRNSTASREMTVLSLIQLQSIYMNMEHTLLSFERNTYGEIFQEKLFQQEDNFPVWDRGILVKYYNESGTKWNWGIKITSGNKTSHCILFKEDYEKGSIIAQAEYYMFELQNFVDDGTGHYAASYGHDDLIMCSVQLEFVKKTLQYKLLRDEYDSGQSQQSEDVYNPYESIGMQEVSMDPFGSGNPFTTMPTSNNMPVEMIENRRRFR